MPARTPLAPDDTGAATLPDVDTWRCPHCGTTQADGPRCWACSRHPFACGSCRNFRKAVAGRFGYCALDRTRAELQGDEVRACWQAPVRTESYEGLFRELTIAPDLVATDTPVPSRQAAAGQDGSRTWAIPVDDGGSGPASEASSRPAGEHVQRTSGPATPGLVEAPYVPARRIVSMAPRRTEDTAALLDGHLPGLRGDAAAGRDHPGGDDDRSAGGTFAEQPEA